MKNKLNDLNDYLFEQIERLNDDSMTPEESEIAIKKAKQISEIGTVIIQNANLQLQAVKTAAEYGIVSQNKLRLLLGDNSTNEKIQ